MECGGLFVANTRYFNVLREIINMPFYKVDNGYRYGGQLLQDEEKSPNLVRFFEDTGDDTESDEAADIIFDNDRLNQQFMALVDEMLNLLIPDECFDLWNTYHKETGEIKTYHDLIGQMKELLFSAAMKDTVSTLDIHDFTVNDDRYDDYHYRESDLVDKKIATSHDALTGRRTLDLVLTPFYEKSQNEETKSSQKVLNRKNPFADISIKEQSFIYGSSYGQFETLRMTTSHMVTKVENDTETSFISMQPGFKIQKEHDCIVKESPSVIFDDTLSSKMADDDEECYVYID